MVTSLERVQAAVIDGRARTPRYIQKQLSILHNALVNASEKIHTAIVQDSAQSSAETWLEIHQTLQAVKDQYSSINFTEFLVAEYSIANGKDRLERRRPYGCAYILLSRHTRFNSIAQPVAAAIAAGNCVVLEMPNTSLALDRVIREALLPVMDKDTFAIINERPTSDSFFTKNVIVVNTTEDQRSAFGVSKSLTSPTSPAVAIVDRSAHIANAVEHIIRARFSFCGASPYAPDLVFVNEFIVEDFCKAALKVFTSSLSDSLQAPHKMKSRAHKASSTEQQDPETTVLIAGTRGSIQLSNPRGRSFTIKKDSRPILTIQPMTSLDNAIDVVTSANTPLAALYLFAEPKAAKYLSQFINADISLTNHIPPQLLVGPTGPSEHAISLAGRFTEAMFSVPSPERINSSKEEAHLAKFLDGNAQRPDIEKLRSDIQRPIADMKEPVGNAVGFFEQGFFTGMAVEATLLISVVVVCAKFVVPKLLKK